MSEETKSLDLDILFPFTYSGGGYFRKNGYKIGENAPILHGKQAIQYLYLAMNGVEEEQIMKQIL